MLMNFFKRFYKEESAEESFLRRKGRFELKYLLSSQAANQMILRLNSYMKKDPFVQGENFYMNRSLYFDTADLKEYREYADGEKRRQKYRMRNYSLDSPWVNLEVKNKLNRTVWKDKFKGDKSFFMDLIDDPWSFSDNSDYKDLAFAFAKYRYQPTVAVIYQRVPLVDALGSDLRITFDYNVRGGRAELFDREPNDSDKRLLPSGEVILEIKFNSQMPKWCGKVLNEFQLSPTTFSKYATAVEKVLLEDKGE